MFTIFARSEKVQTELETAETDFQARFLARRWSRVMDVEVAVFEDGAASPRCVYRHGAEVFCACPRAGSPEDTASADFTEAPKRSA